MKAKAKKVMKAAGVAVLGALNREDVKAKLAAELEKSRAMAEKEIAKAKKKIEGTLRKAENYMKSNPEKAAMIAAGIGAALGSALTMYANSKAKKAAPKKKK